MSRIYLTLLIMALLTLYSANSYSSQAEAISIKSDTTLYSRHIGIYIYGNYSDYYTLARLFSYVNLFGGAGKPYISIILPPAEDLPIKNLLIDINNSYDDINLYAVNTSYDRDYYQSIFGKAPIDVSLDKLVYRKWLNRSAGVIFPLPKLDLNRNL